MGDQLIPLFKVRMAPDIDERLAPTLLSGFISQGPKVKEFERAVRSELDLQRSCIAVNSATSGIELSWDLIGIEPGDEVISTPMTCFATNVGLARRGAKIVWSDIDPDTGLIDPESVKAKISNKTKAIIGVNWAGQFADYKALKSFGLPVVEDAAHTWDVYQHNECRGDYVVYSLQAIKFLTTGDGGILIAPGDKEEEARSLRWYGLDREKDFRVSQNITMAGYKFNMNDIDAQIGLANLRYARHSVNVHRENSSWLYELTMNAKYFKPVPVNTSASYWVWPMILSEHVDREHFGKYLEANGFGSAQIHYRNDQYDICPDPEKPLPGVDSFSSRQINVPCGWWMNKEDVAELAHLINSYAGD